MRRKEKQLCEFYTYHLLNLSFEPALPWWNICGVYNEVTTVCLLSLLCKWKNLYGQKLTIVNFYKWAFIIYSACYWYGFRWNEYWNENGLNLVGMNTKMVWKNGFQRCSSQFPYVNYYSSNDNKRTILWKVCFMVKVFFPDCSKNRAAEAEQSVHQIKQTEGNSNISSQLILFRFGGKWTQ